MYYSTYDAYNYDENFGNLFYNSNNQLIDITNNQKECLICFDTEKVGNEIYYLKDIIIFENNCLCNAYFHFHCLQTWLHVNSACPICRNKSLYSYKLQTYHEQIYNTILFIDRLKYVSVLVKQILYILYFIIIITFIDEICKQVYNFI